MALWLLPMALVVRLTILVRQRAPSEFAAVDTFAAADIAVVGVSGLVLFALPRTRQVLRVIAGTSAMIIVAFYGLCLVSSVWSAEPMYTAFRAIQVLTQMGMAFLILSYYRSFRSAERSILAITVIILVLDILGRARLAGWSGMHTNSYSAIASMLVCYCFGEYFRADRKRRRRLATAAVTGFAGLVIGTCSSSNIGTLCGMAAAGVLRDSKMRTVMILLIAVCIALYVSGGADILEQAAYKVLLPGKTPERAAHMTGRLHLWQWAFEKISERPILGHGFAVAVRDSLKANTTHNTLIAILLDTGIIGLGLFVAASGRLLRETALASRYRTPGVVGCWCAFVAAIVNCMGVPFLAVDWRPATLVFSLLLALHTMFVLRGARNGRAPRAPRPQPVRYKR